MRRYRRLAAEILRRAPEKRRRRHRRTRGVRQLQLKSLDEAVANFRLSIKYRPDNVIAHQNLAKALNEKGDSDAAIAAATEALRLDPNYPFTRIDLALALFNKLRLVEAEK